MIRIKGPYSLKETEFLRSLVYIGLKKLVDIGKWVNYEECCQSIIDNIPATIYAPEFDIYWKNWKNKFESERTKKKRRNIFNLCITDLQNKGLLPGNIHGLTGNFSGHIARILSKKSTN